MRYAADGPVAKKKTLTELRRAVDDIDQRLLRLLSRRGRVANEIGQAKSRGSRAVLDAGRERAVIRSILDANPGPLSDASIEAVFREVISACRSSQEPAPVAFLGPEGSFSHDAATRQFGGAAALEPVQTIGDVFAAVEAGRAAYGVVPLENTIEGAVTPTLDCMVETGISILAELKMKVDLHLMSRDGKAGKLRAIVSHPQPLAQARRTLASRFPGLRLETAASTAAAAELASKRATTAALAGPLAAKRYGLNIVARSLQDDPGNVTRFVVVGKGQGAKRTRNDRTSLVVSVRDEVGVLEKVLRPFAANSVNLSMIESRPLYGRPWEYSFYIEVSGHTDDGRVKKALAGLSRVAIHTKVLGSYPIAE